MDQANRNYRNVGSASTTDTVKQSDDTSRTQSPEHVKARRYGVGKQTPTPAGQADEGNISGSMNTENTGGPSGNITGTQFDQNPRTAKKD